MDNTLATNLLKNSESVTDIQTLAWTTNISNIMMVEEKNSARAPGPYFEVNKKIEVNFKNPEGILYPIHGYIVNHLNGYEEWSVAWALGSDQLIITPRYCQNNSRPLNKMLDCLKMILEEANQTIQEVNKILVKLRQEAEVKFQDVTI
jgi:hypothetical protein